LSQHYWKSWVKSPDDAQISDALIGYWVRFMQTGNPNTPALPAWPAYSPQQDLVQMLGREVTTARDPRSEKFAPFQQYLDSRLERLPHHGAATSQP
jgi:para-nitrobenzyl esterase